MKRRVMKCMIVDRNNLNRWIHYPELFPSFLSTMPTLFLYSLILHRLLITGIRTTWSQFSPTNTQQLLIVRQLTQVTYRKRLAILEVPIELLLQIVVDILHGIAAVAVNHVVICRSELRATLQQHHPFSLWMREVHGKGLIQNEKRETGLS